MTANARSTLGEWDANNSFTVSANSTVLLSNPSSFVVYFTRTANSTPPSGEISAASALRPLDSISLSMLDGEYLWVAGNPNARVNIEN